VLSNFPQLSETFIVSKFLGLLNRGWDVHIVCSHSEKTVWNNFPELMENSLAKKHVHKTWPVLPRWLPFLLLPFAILRSISKSPVITWHYFFQGFKRFGWDILRRFYLDEEIILLKPDILHFEFGTLAIGRTYIKQLLDLKLSVSFRGYDLNFIGLDDPQFYQEIWQKADACHFLGNDLWQRAQRRGCPPDMPHVHIPPAINLEEFPSPIQSRPGRLGTAERPLRILSIGRLAWKKGYEFSLHALKMLIDQGYYCIYKIIGEGPYKPALRFACHQLGINDDVEFLGSLTHIQVIEFLSWPDVFLHAAVSEGFCNAVLEAQAMGVPIICSDADGLAENVEDGITGFVVPRRNPAAIAKKLALLSKDGNLRKGMGEAGRLRVIEKFLIRDQISKFNFFYSELLNRL